MIWVWMVIRFKQNRLLRNTHSDKSNHPCTIKCYHSPISSKRATPAPKAWEGGGRFVKGVQAVGSFLKSWPYTNNSNITLQDVGDLILPRLVCVGLSSRKSQTYWYSLSHRAPSPNHSTGSLPKERTSHSHDPHFLLPWKPGPPKAQGSFFLSAPGPSNVIPRPTGLEWEGTIRGSRALHPYRPSATGPNFIAGLQPQHMKTPSIAVGHGWISPKEEHFMAKAWS